MLNGLLRRFDSRDYIFCINTGRSGSDYLAKLLDSAAEVSAFHEPKPEMTKAMLGLVTNDTYRNTFSKRAFKARAIRKLAKSVNAKVYAETNHMFIKTFPDVVAKRLKNVKVIFLKRNLIDTLYSFYELGYFSDWEHSWKEWMILPNAKTAAIQTMIKGEKPDQVSLIIGYLLDIRARAARFKSEFPAVPVYEINLYELNDKVHLVKMFEWLNITPTEKTYELIGKKQNDRTDLKKKIGGTVPDKPYLKQRFYEHIEKLKALGIEIPADVLSEM
ncbi:MAG: hypothetical protein M3R17_20345 [Bacteroidota bacterium]|nr:hypothetical protein [Bacteroidota bacterium]